MVTNYRLFGAALVLALCLAPHAVAQEASPKPVRRIFTHSTMFRLPVEIDARERGDLSAVKLFVKLQPGEWVCQETAPATQNAFSFRAKQDGEYWFAFATVDKAGVATPAVPDDDSPALIVIVDTVPPEVDVRPLPGAGQVYLQCRLHDANPDYSSIKIEYETEGQSGVSWTPLVAVPDTPGVFQVPAKSVLEGKIKVQAADKAGNVVGKVIDLGPKPTIAAGPPPAAAAPGPLASPAPPNPAPTVVTDTNTMPKPAPAGPLVASKPRPPALLPADLIATPTEGSPPANVIPAAASAGAAESVPVTATQPSSREVPFLNSLRGRMELSVEPVPGGIAKVDVWLTPDAGKTWQFGGESRDGRVPAIVEFPRDGLYGFCFVVKPMTGPATPTPMAGDAPDGWLEVDTTKPVAELIGVTVGAGPEAGQVVITWVAHDKNLGPMPVVLSYAVQPNGPWYSIADKLANSGTHHWAAPKDIGNRVFIRLEVFDRAGNTTRCDYPGAVALDGPRPKVKVLSVSPAMKE